MKFKKKGKGQRATEMTDRRKKVTERHRQKETDRQNGREKDRETQSVRGKCVESLSMLTDIQ